MDTLPVADDCRRRLHRAGWSVGEFATVDTEGRQTWHVSGRNGANAVEAEGATQGEAWQRACWQAEALGMLRRCRG
jgi:hypothetical protein